MSSVSINVEFPSFLWICRANKYAQLIRACANLIGTSNLMTENNQKRQRLLKLMSRKEGNVLLNDALNTFYLRLYGVRHMVKDHSDSEKGNPLPPHRLLFTINSKVLLYAPSHRQDSTYHGLCYTSRGALAGTRLM